MARDLFHEAVKIALEKEGWTVTDDPYVIKNEVFSGKLYIDIGAERLLVAEKGTEKIAVEVKSFTEQSLIHSFYKAVGQMLGYQIGLRLQEPDRILYLAIPKFAHAKMLTEPIYMMLMQENNIHFFVYDADNNEIILWQE